MASTKSIKSAAVLLAAVTSCFFVVAGCGDSSTGNNLNSNAGTLTTHTNSANAVVVDANKEEANSGVMSEINSAMAGGFSKKLAKTPATYDTSYSKTIQGDSSGSVDVGIHISATTSGAGYKVQATETATYNDCSNYGYIYIGGQFTMKVNAIMDAEWNMTSETIAMDGSIRFNGSYIGTMTFSYDISMTSTNTGSYSFSSTITSGKKSVAYSKKGTIDKNSAAKKLF
jgi:outer membrane murein-binding lipoprotein Lpp